MGAKRDFSRKERRGKIFQKTTSPVVGAASCAEQKRKGASDDKEKVIGKTIRGTSKGREEPTFGWVLHRSSNYPGRRSRVEEVRK